MRLFLKMFGLVLLALLLAAGGVAWRVASNWQPRLDGTLQADGLRSGATLARDAQGVVRISADNPWDAAFALGFAHAQDRLWQMEMQRRLGAGRLAEILGDKALPTDRFMRTLGLYRLAQGSVEALAPDVRDTLQAYADGVNAYLRQAPQAPAPEFLLTGYRPEPWSIADSLVWARLMALQLAGNWRDELLRAGLLTNLPADQVNDLWPGSPPNQPVTIGRNDGFDAAAVERMLAAIPADALPRLASNVWVVSGERSETGKPILANDPHLTFQAPTLWYLASIEAPGLHLSGGTVPGSPLVLIGHNDHIAWGMTTTHSDTMDLFIEQVQGDGYVTPDGVKPFLQRTETIHVKDGPDQTLTVRETRHGPVISDVLGARGDGTVLALQATALLPQDTTPQALHRLNRARNWDDFRQALRDFQAPQQNIAYADIDGHIGLISPGKVPIRKSGDGTLPRPGANGDFDWIGWVPFDQLPQSFDPPSGVIINANNRLVGPGYPYLLTASWPEGYRAARIAELLEQKDRFSVQDMADMQMDELSLMAVDLKPLLLRAPASGPRAAGAMRLIKDWTGVTDRNRPEPLIFETWMRSLQAALLQNRLGDQAGQFSRLNPLFVKAVLQGRPLWCAAKDQPATATLKDCDALVSRSLDQSLDEIEHRHGDILSDWRWGDAHQARFKSLLFSHIPVLGPLVDLSVPTGGDDFTLQRGSFGPAEPGLFANLHGAGLRMTADLAEPDRSRFVLSTGQSGNPLSSHWSDMLALWSAGQTLSLSATRDFPHILQLEPKT